MAAWWRMQCEEAHVWELFRDDDGEPPESDFICPTDGSPAITGTKLPLADMAVITLRPATWEREGSQGRKGEYFVQISSSAVEEETRTLKNPVPWERAVKLAQLVQGLPWEQADRRWQRLAPGYEKSMEESS